MADPLPTHLETLFTAALDCSTRERDTLIAELCRQHPEHEPAIRLALMKSVASAESELPPAIKELVLAALDRPSTEREQALAELRDLYPQSIPAIRRYERLSPRPGDVVDAYRVVRPLGGGGMGRVYAAEHVVTRQVVALKLIAPSRLHDHGALRRFAREARLAAAVHHPRLVFVYAAGMGQECPFIAMELVEGSDLDRLVRDNGPLPVPRALNLILQVLDGLQAAHEAHVIHRDVKPSNCFLDDAGGVRLGDFGLSRSLAPLMDLTGAAGLGTPAFAAPEQWQRSDVDARADVYGAAATLYWILSGRYPHDADSLEAYLMAQAAGKPTPLRMRGISVSPGLDAVVLRALAREPNARWPSAAAFADALAPFVATNQLPASTARRTAAGCIDLSALGVLVRGLHRVGLPSEAAVVAVPLAFLCNGIIEGAFGQTLGQRAMGIRVMRAEMPQPPGIARGVVRAAIALAWFGSVAMSGWNPWCLAIAVISTLLVALPLTGKPLQDRLTDTRVVLATRPRTGRRRAPWGTADPRDRVPDPRGLEIRGRLATLPPIDVFVAFERELHRDLWLTFVDAVDDPNAPRRSLARSTRLRWVSSGSAGGSSWHAFAPPYAVPLYVATLDGLPWASLRSLLLSLCDELERGDEEESLPRELHADLLWVDAEDRAVIVEDLVTPPSARGRPGLGRVGFLYDVARKAAWGVRAFPGQTGWPPLPGDALAALEMLVPSQALVDVDAFRRALALTTPSAEVPDGSLWILSTTSAIASAGCVGFASAIPRPNTIWLVACGAAVFVLVSGMLRNGWLLPFAHLALASERGGVVRQSQRIRRAAVMLAPLALGLFAGIAARWSFFSTAPHLVASTTTLLCWFALQDYDLWRGRPLHDRLAGLRVVPARSARPFRSGDSPRWIT